MAVGGTAHTFDERFERAVKWVRSIPDDDLSRSSHGGHGRCYRHLRGLALGFLIRDRDALEELVSHYYNGQLAAAAERHPDRAAEFEPWEGRELAHKLAEAIERPPDPDFPPGHLLPRGDVDAADGFRPMAWNNPARLAGEFTKAHDVLFVKDTAFRYAGGRYGALHDTPLAKEVRGFIESQANREFDRQSREWEADNAAELKELRADERDGKNLERVRTQLTRLEKTRPGGVPSVTNKLVSETVGALRVRRQLPDDTQLDTWIDGSNRPPVLAVGNGLLDPVARKLHAPSSAWFSVIALPVAFDPAAPPPAKWIGYLNDVMQGDAERVAVLQEVAGACLDPYTVKLIAFLAGRGDNGKSAFLVALTALLGKPNVSAVELEKFAQNQFASSGLAGKLANIVGDQSFFESKDEAWLKTLTGGDTVRFEQKGKDAVFGVNRAKLIFGCNDPPTIADKSEATWNRLVMVPFKFTVPADRRNPAMLTAEYWSDELPGVLNWALDGLARLRANRGRLTRSAACEALKEKHRKDSNPARAFLLETCEPGQPGDYVRVDELFSAYQRWCGDGGYRHPLGKNRFGAVVRVAFPHVGDESRPRKIGAAVVRVWEGIRLQQGGNEVTNGNET